jgi:hypothetical protein
MALYSLYLPSTIDPRSLLVSSKLRVVKDGFSWWAFIFPLPWLLVNRLWLWSFLFFCANLLLGFAAQAFGASEAILAPCILFLSIFIGLEAGVLKAEGLRRRSFLQVASFIAGSAEEAELKFFSSQEVASAR